MLLPTMNAEEVLAEMKNDMLWVSDRFDGLFKKYRRVWVKSPKNSFKMLGSHRYTTPRNNRWLVIVMLHNDSLAFSLSAIYDKGSYGKTYYQFFERTKTNEPTVSIMNPHFFDRVKSRLGMGAEEYLSNAIFAQLKTVDGSDAVYMSDNLGIGLGRQVKQGVPVYKLNTIITYEMLRDDQKQYANEIRDLGLSKKELIDLCYKK